MENAYLGGWHRRHRYSMGSNRPTNRDLEEERE
jgi:hypothetical protein